MTWSMDDADARHRADVPVDGPSLAWPRLPVPTHRQSGPAAVVPPPVDPRDVRRWMR